ncbi:MAG: 3-dehydroquinate synthase II, partial [Promethearchaeota archaeon]
MSVPDKSILFHVHGNWINSKTYYVELITKGFTFFLIKDPSIAEKVQELGKVQIIGPKSLENVDYRLVDDVNEIPIPEMKSCMFLTISTKQDEKKAVELAEAGVDMLIIDAKDWKVIPYENLIAELQKKNTILIATVKDTSEARLFLETLEIGVDGVMFEIHPEKTSIDDLDLPAIRQLIEKGGKVDLIDLEIVKIEEIGSGDRVCVDTISLLKPGEGMLIGNQARGFFFVHAETADTEFVNARPFRVNAGAIHSYILNPGNKTSYLSELKSGSEVMIVDLNGKTKKTKVGRAKIETRPMLLIEAKYKDDLF